MKKELNTLIQSIVSNITGPILMFTHSKIVTILEEYTYEAICQHFKSRLFGITGIIV